MGSREVALSLSELRDGINNPLLKKMKAAPLVMAVL